MSSSVSYEVVVDGAAQAQGGYQVKQGTPARELAPVVYCKLVWAFRLNTPRRLRRESCYENRTPYGGNGHR